MKKTNYKAKMKLKKENDNSDDEPRMDISTTVQKVDEEMPPVQTRHMADGITYMRPYFYKCKYCKKRLNREQMLSGFCEDKVDPVAPVND